MKILSPLILLLVVPALAWARQGAFPVTETAANAGIGIKQTGVLTYPASMMGEGIYSGEVRAVISVDAEGNLSDWLVTGYTQPAFAEAASAAIQRWKYEPTLVDGRARASRADILFEFRLEGVIVMTLPGASTKHAFRQILEERYAYRPVRLSELDRIPTPVHVVPPVARIDGPPRTVTVGFYIDEEGRVRMPAVERESADDLLAAAAVAAVEQWRFEPPLRKGGRVLVYAYQEFTFKPKE
ncbi:Gram-negative bacterial tonB protein [Lacunisphaera limnophila]|uniref:Gram-negative bacterial tonB protein n=1 Tax=Lacunisphaera limnophila TaxID=1838286 RepID=A0A1D8AW23_9BACT|nr:TonB family protein [Lacunisphaera limnophila]AOS45066.1 Gram-negative bacterial tonB protein [Lacunisphaera limnophila]